MIRKSPIAIVIFAVLLSGIIMVFASVSPIAVVRAGLTRAFHPLMRFASSAGNRIGSGDRGISFSSSDSCDSCDADGVARAVAEAKLIQVAEENESLKKMLGLKQNYAPSLIPAAVAVYNQEWDREWLVIDAGADAGVRSGDPVIDENQFLIGEVAEVTAVSATVAIASNRDVTFNVALVSESGEALAHGLGARAFGVELIPRGTPVGPGDMVMRVSESHKKLPPIFAGRMVHVDDRAGGAFKIGKAVLLSHPERVLRVLVVSAL